MINIFDNKSLYTDKEIITYIENKTRNMNYDNISRTKAYENYYFRLEEIQWALLAGMVSRNAGWSMTDLKGIWFRKALNEQMRSLLFMTYERANWMIFQDAFPQLLVYEFSKILNKPLFYLLNHFNVSIFMIKEWELFWKKGRKDRLVNALIINEQNVIHKPVIEHKLYKKHVFKSLDFRLQDLLHFSTVVFPTLNGKLFGFSVNQFTQLTKRIELGKRLSWLLFHSGLYDEFVNFAKTVVHTGTRYDYEIFMSGNRKRKTPLLRTAYPMVSHSLDENKKDWFQHQNTNKWFKDIAIPNKYELTDWFNHKQDQLHLLTILKEYNRNG
ncbi:hypothetical protein JOC75_000003 [Metabacillus crassostreae]|uniref:DUF2515 family protein n=1 Tax=Metabacillus crassostreae TaxID=929098 RepID=UPI0019577D37|nr:DUF2515 family protein [Metabacillus crassostreae]MBM7602033.1 hypothetical protein [Metabacillus crassostreae]